MKTIGFLIIVILFVTSILTLNSALSSGNYTPVVDTLLGATMGSLIMWVIWVIPEEEEEEKTNIDRV